MDINFTQLEETALDYVAIGAEAEIPNGERLILEIDDTNLVVFNIAGKLFAIGDICSHDDGPIAEGEVEGYEVDCPRHGGRFDIRNGKPTLTPAVVDIPAYPVRIKGGQIEVGLPKE